MTQISQRKDLAAVMASFGKPDCISMRHSLTWNAPGKGRLSEVVELEVCDVMWIAEPAQYVS